MAIPVYLQQFKAAGVYRIVFDKSTVLGVDTEILRLVVGYSEQGPFNVPTYITSVSDFKSIYGDISKKLERRGCFFHRTALQALATGPILCLNLKKFKDETVNAATINVDFGTENDPIELGDLKVEDIYDTSRFWKLEPEKLNDAVTTSGRKLDEYINITAIDTKKKSNSFFIRKASGSKVAGYNVTVSDWYKDESAEVPEYLQDRLNSYISDFMAEIYVFNGKFNAEQVMASSTLKNYFNYNSETKELSLKPYVTDAFGDVRDTLDALYNDATSGAIGHWVGVLLPEFVNKNGSYMSLDILFNVDSDIHSMMMSFNTDMIYEEENGGDIVDLSGRRLLDKDEKKTGKVTVKDIYEGTAKVNLLGATNVPVIADKVTFSTNVTKEVVKEGETVPTTVALYPFSASPRTVSGTLYISHIVRDTSEDDKDDSNDNDKTVTVTFTQLDNSQKTVIVNMTEAEYKRSKIVDIKETNEVTITDYDSVFGLGKIITSITNLKVNETASTDEAVIYTAGSNIKFSVMDVQTVSSSETRNKDANDNTKEMQAVYGSSLSFVSVGDWGEANSNVSTGFTLTSATNDSLISFFKIGDCLVGDADDIITDEDGNGDPDKTLDNVYVQEIGYNNEKKNYYITFTAEPLQYITDDGPVLVRINAPLAQEIGTMKPTYLEGYTYKEGKPDGTSMKAKLDWQKFQLSAIEDYKGIRTGLLNKSDIDYRYIVDTFETFVDSGAKKILSFLAKEKQSAFAILNFPSVRTFVKCPYASFTDSKGVFNVQYVVDGANKKKASSIGFSLPSDAEGASFCAFYTPLKFTDGYTDNILPSAGLVSNLFMEKYMSRQPYYIIAGPNYGNISAAGLVGPDYNYSMAELQIIEPYGVNCMVYRPNFGTFINANQTAKQTPKSALSSVNVRELVIYLQDEIEKVLQAYQWEFNNPVTRNAILNKANQICSRVQSNGGIQAYLNVMDESNNTPEIIDNEMAILSTHIEPGRGCGKMIHELTLYRTGQMSATISE